MVTRREKHLIDDEIIKLCLQNVILEMWKFEKEIFMR